jgi:hypothetical protein
VSWGHTIDSSIPGEVARLILRTGFLVSNLRGHKERQSWTGPSVYRPTFIPKSQVASFAVRVYEYGCGPGTFKGLDRAIEQMQHRNAFWNRIVDIDNNIRTRMDALLFAGPQEVELSLLREKLKKVLRNRAVPSAVGRFADSGNDQPGNEINVLRAGVRAKLTEVKPIRKENAAKNRLPLRELDTERKARIAQAQTDAASYWANRDEIRRKYEIARARAMREGRRLRSQPWDETGRISVYFQRGLSVKEAFSENGRLQIDPVPEDAWKSPSRAVRRRLARTRARIRVVANEDRSPVWLDVPLILHRPLPEHGVIRSVSFDRERIGLNFRHRLLFTVREPAFPEGPKSEKAVGLDLGWRVTPDGLRVAYWCGEDGSSGALVVPVSDLAAFKKIGSLEPIIVSLHSSAVSFLRGFLSAHSVPTALKESASTAIASSSPRALLRFFEMWQTHRFEGDKSAFDVLQQWHKQHVHLWTWQANLRDQMIRRRRELYRRFAADLASRYGRMFVNDIPLRRRTIRPTAVETLIPAQRQHRFIAALSVLYRILQHAFEKRDGIVMRLKCKGATKSCHFCGALDDWNPASTLMHTCSNCGQTWDQDFNAAIHGLREGRSMLPSPSLPSGNSDEPAR